MDNNFNDDELDPELDATMNEGAAPVSSARAERFYDRMRTAIRNYLEKRGALAGKTGEYLLLAPDVFVLLWRLVNDARVNSKNKMMLGSGLAYYFFPLDIMPEGFMGPVGYIDDLVFGVYLLNKMLSDTDVAVLREHWSGSDDVLNMIRNVLNAADNLVGSDILTRIKKAMR
ncbi:MAG TPA: DUF1232 domain-containing protein [Thermoanaerobaculia bacterium]|jgi:uncharacterized membrane protein YkvA (DUF1232 family)